MPITEITDEQRNELVAHGITHVKFTEDWTTLIMLVLDGPLKGKIIEVEWERY